MGGAYAALDAYQSTTNETKFFLNTLWTSGDIYKASLEITQFLSKSNGFESRLLDASRNTLSFLNATRIKYNLYKVRETETIASWMNDIASYIQVVNVLKADEAANDMSGFLYGIVNFSSQNQMDKNNFISNVISYHIDDTKILVASTDNNIIAQSIWDGLGGGIGSGVEWLIGGIAGTALYAISDITGKIRKIVFKSDGDDGRNQEEKDTDEAIGQLLEGATPVDKQGKPLQPGQTVSGAKNYVKPGDAFSDFGNFADDLGTVSEGKTTPRGPIRTIDMPDGGSAIAYPESTSGNVPTIEINPSRGRGLGSRIKIRYSDGRRATILIPTTRS